MVRWYEVRACFHWHGMVINVAEGLPIPRGARREENDNLERRETGFWIGRAK